MNIQDAKRLYPEFATLSDHDFAERVYESEYAQDMSKDEFFARTGFPKKLSNYEAADVGAKTAWEDIFHGVTQLMKPADNAKDGIPKYTQQMAAMIPAMIAGNPLLAVTNKREDTAIAMQRDAKFQNALEQHPTSAFLGNVASSMVATAPLAATPTGAAALSAHLAKLMPSLSRAATMASKKVPQSIQKISSGAATGAFQGGAASGLAYAADAEERLAHALSGAEIGALFGGAFEVPAAALKGTRSMMRGGQDINKIKENVAAAKGTKTGAGQVFNVPSLIQLQENFLDVVPLGGGSTDLKKTADQLSSEAEKIYGKITGGFGGAGAGDPRKVMHADLNAVIKGKMDKKNSLYSTASELAEASGVRSPSSNLYVELRKIQEDLVGEKISQAGFDNAVKADIEDLISRADKSNKLLRPAYDALKAENKKIDAESIFSKADSLYEQYKKNMQGKLEDATVKFKPFNDVFGKQSLSELEKINTMVGEKMRGYAVTSPTNNRIYSMLNSAVKRDIEDFEGALSQDGTKQAKQAYSAAKQYYKSEIAPIRKSKLAEYFDDKDLTNSEKILSDFLTAAPQKDRYETLGLLFNNLTPTGQAAARAEYFAPSFIEGQFGSYFDPRKMASLYSKLGKNEKNVFFGGAKNPEIAKSTIAEMDALSNKIRMNQKAIDYKLNPNTGKALQLMENIYKTAAIGSGVAMSAGIPIMPSVLGALAATSAASKGVRGLLNSEKLRTSIVEAMERDIAGQQKQTSVGKILRTMLPSLTYATEASMAPLELEIKPSMAEK